MCKSEYPMHRYPRPIRVLSTDSQQHIDDRQLVADRIYSAAIASGASQQDAEDAVERRFCWALTG